MSHHHVRVVCVCGAVVRQCRCMAPKKTKVEVMFCESCRPKKKKKVAA